MSFTPQLRVGTIFIAIGILAGLTPANDAYADRPARMAEFHIGQSMRFQQKGDFDRALKELEKGLSENPNSARTYFNIGNLQLTRGLFKESSEAFEKAVKLYQDTSEHLPTNDPFTRLESAKDNLGFTYTILGRYDDAIKLHQEIRNPPFDDYGPDRGLAVAYMLKGDMEKSRKHLDFYLKHIESTDPKLAEGMKRLADKVASNELSSEAFLAYMKASYSLNDRDKSKEYLQLALTEDPQEPLFQELLQKITSAENVKDVRNKAKRNGQVESIRSFIMKGDNSKAIKEAKKFVKKRRDDPTGYLMLGVAYGQNGDIDKSIEAYLDGLKVLPTSDTLNYNLAHTYFVTRSYRSAEQYAQRTIEINPKYPDVHGLLAKIRLAQKQYQNALDLFELEAEISPRNPSVLSNMGEIYYQYLKDYPKAIEYYDKALALNPNDIQILKWKSDAYFQMNDFIQARDVMIRAKEKMQKKPQLQAAVSQAEAWVSELQKRIDEP